MAPHRPDDDPSDELPAAEAARDRRRDHDAGAGARSGMRTGLAKQFKQVLDAQARRAREADERESERRPASRPAHPRTRRHPDAPS
jgi:hypothetical protein